MRNKIFNFTLKTIHRMAVLIVCAIFVPLWVEGAVEVGGVLSPFELGGSARALGMGGAAVAVTGDGDSFFENPATLATLSYRQVLTFHAPLFLDTLYDSVGYVHPI